MMKACTKCGVEKELTEFHRKSCTSDKHTSICKLCARAKASAWVKTNSERHKKSVAAYHAAHPATKRKANKAVLLALTERDCNGCGKTKPISEFGRASKKRGNRPLATCKQCATAQTVEWQKANPSKRALINAMYYKNNPEKMMSIRPRQREQQKKRHEKNPEKYLTVARKWKALNKEKVAVDLAAWKKQNRAHCTTQQRLRDAKKLQATPTWANDFFISEIYDLAARRTKIKCGGFSEWQVDHIIPLKSKLVCGLHVENNLQVIPAVLNRSKNNRYWPDMPMGL